MIHEASHWFVTVGADDYGYGESFCKNLAKNEPDKAKENADNYDYFTYYTYITPGGGGEEEGDDVDLGKGAVAEGGEHTDTSFEGMSISSLVPGSRHKGLPSLTGGRIRAWRRRVSPR